MCWVHTLLQDGKSATSDFGEVGSDGGQRWDEIGHANWSSRNTTTRPTRPCATRWSTPTTSGTKGGRVRGLQHRRPRPCVDADDSGTDGPETAAPTAHSPTVRCRGTDQLRHHCRRRHRSTDQRHHCCGQRHHRRRRRRGRSRVGLRVQRVVGRFAAVPDHDQPDTVRRRRTRPPDGHEPIPGPLARALVIGNADTAIRTWVRRLCTDPPACFGRKCSKPHEKRAIRTALLNTLVLRT